MIIVIPMSGFGTRFKNIGITTPKPIIDVKGKWMLDWSLKSLDLSRAGKIIFIIYPEHENEYGISAKLKEKYGEKCVCLFDPSPTGAASTVLVAKQYIDTDEDIVVKDCDGYIVSHINDTIEKNMDSGIDGILSTTNMPGDRFSFARLDENGYVCEVAEKRRISDHIITGMYYFRHGSDFVKYAEKMIAENKRVKNEFYIAPVYEEMIKDGKKIIIDEAEKLWDLGTPETLQYFLENFKD